MLEQGLHNRLWELISAGLCAFVGQTAFEEICRQWTRQQAAAGRLSFLPDAVGRHWGREVEIDVAAINWTERRLLLGECKWGEEDVGRSVIASLILERGPRLLARLEGEWQVEYVFFARAGFTAAAQALAEEQGARLVTLAQVDGDLSDWLEARGLSA